MDSGLLWPLDRQTGDHRNYVVDVLLDGLVLGSFAVELIAVSRGGWIVEYDSSVLFAYRSANPTSDDELPKLHGSFGITHILIMIQKTYLILA